MPLHTTKSKEADPSDFSVMPGPCVICGDTNYPESYGGPGICNPCHNGVKPFVRIRPMLADLACTKLEIKEAKKRFKSCLSLLTALRPFYKNLPAWKTAGADQEIQEIERILKWLRD